MLSRLLVGSSKYVSASPSYYILESLREVVRVMEKMCALLAGNFIENRCQNDLSAVDQVLTASSALLALCAMHVHAHAENERTKEAIKMRGNASVDNSGDQHGGNALYGFLRSELCLSVLSRCCTLPIALQSPQSALCAVSTLQIIVSESELHREDFLEEIVSTGLPLDLIRTMVAVHDYADNDTNSRHRQTSDRRRHALIPLLWKGSRPASPPATTSGLEAMSSEKGLSPSIAQPAVLLQQRSRSRSQSITEPGHGVRCGSSISACCDEIITQIQCELSALFKSESWREQISKERRVEATVDERFPLSRACATSLALECIYLLKLLVCGLGYVLDDVLGGLRAPLGPVLNMLLTPPLLHTLLTEPEVGVAIICSHATRRPVAIWGSEMKQVLLRTLCNELAAVDNSASGPSDERRGQWDVHEALASSRLANLYPNVADELVVDGVYISLLLGAKVSDPIYLTNTSLSFAVLNVRMTSVQGTSHDS